MKAYLLLKALGALYGVHLRVISVGRAGSYYL